MLDASLANEVVDSDELSVDEDDVNVEASSSLEALFVLLDPSSLAASVSSADCLVKLCSKQSDNDE